MNIRTLPDHVANLIAAGEVVERPAAVVRELLDNAIDAGAKNIEIEIREGGQSLIRVSDDGSGIAAEDVPLAFGRHATSKIRTTEDLDAISTRGFRGEALASIAAVAKVTLSTRDEAPLGVEIRVDGGQLHTPRNVGRPRGTEVVVEQLFFNTPARRKFLKTPRGETIKIRKCVSQFSLACPEVRFRLSADNKELLHYPPRRALYERAKDLFPDLAVSAQLSGPVGVEAFLSHPGIPQPTPEGLVILVNGRVVADRMIVRAVRDGYEGMLREREFPLGVVSIQLAPQAVDVNVHPQKSEVRFRNSSHVFAAVRTAVQQGVRALRGPSGAGSTQLSAASARWADRSRQEGVAMPRPANETIDFQPRLGPAAAAVPEMSPPAVHAAARARFIGQFLDCYLLFDAGEQIYVMDMHAAHERINYNAILGRMQQREGDCQQLLVPLVVELSAEEQEALAPIAQELQLSGFLIEPFGESAVVVRGLPPLVAHGEVEKLVHEIARGAMEDRGSGGSSDWRQRVAARIACHASIRSGQRLSAPEAYALLDRYFAADTAQACPHGRPVMSLFSREQVERWFGRDR